MANDIRSYQEDELLSKSVLDESSNLELNESKNIISLKEIPNTIEEIHELLSLLLDRFESNANPEFKALMEAYVNKANEAEESKVKLANVNLKYDELVPEIKQLRETNRSLINELQEARNELKKLEFELINLEKAQKLSEDDFKNKISSLNKQNIENENKVLEYEARMKHFYEDKLKMLQEMEGKLIKVSEVNEKSKQELLDNNFKLRQSEQELLAHCENLEKQAQMMEELLRDQGEELELKKKEVEYKEAILNQLIKQKTFEKFKFEDFGFEEEEFKKDMIVQQQEERKSRKDQTGISPKVPKKANSIEIIKEKPSFLNKNLFNRLTKD